MALLSLLVATAEDSLNDSSMALQQSNQTMPVQAQAMTEVAAGQAVPPSSHTGAILDAVQNNADSFSHYFQSLAILFCILAIVWGVVWLLRKRGGIFPNSGAALFIESRLSMGPKKWLIVVNAYEKRFLIGVTEQSMSLITEIREESAEVGENRGSSFIPQSMPLIADTTAGGTPAKENMEKSFAALFEKNVGKNSTSEVS